MKNKIILVVLILAIVLIILVGVFYFNSNENKQEETIGKIIENQKIPLSSDTISFVTKCKYNGESVYFVPIRFPDDYSDLYDENGNLLGHPDGGFGGGGDGKFPDFFDERTGCQRIEIN